MSAPVHATTVAIGGRAVLIEGPSGSGKSDLALRLIDRGAVLVSDDRTCLAVESGQLYASAAATIAGRLEVRGVGIVDAPSLNRARVALAVRLGAPERLPDPAFRTLEGVSIPALVVDAREPSAPIKVELALRSLPA